MPGIPRWTPEFFTNALDGVSSAVSPELILPTQLAWGINTGNRGAKPGTRPPLKFRCSLPNGLVQGASYFGVQGGMGIASINGFLYRLRINPMSYSVENIPLPWPNSGIIKQVYMQQTVESIVIQDGQSDAIIYNGSTAVRANPATFGVPRGTRMAYGNGRLWVAINGNELVAGDIRTNLAGSELQFTETNYLSGGGKLFFPRGITGLAFIATTGTSDYGALLVFGSDYTVSIRADITFRDLWAQTPGFETNVLRHTGCISHWSLTEVNQDLYWRDANGGIRSIRSALADENGPGNAPISREVSRLTDFDSPQLLQFCGSIAFNNRLLMLSSPRLNDRGGVTWRDLIPLDFAPISTMRGKSFPAYDGQWMGLNFTHLFQGQFQGKSRAFAVAADDNGANSLWEIMPDGAGSIDDTYEICTDGTGAALASPIECVLEHGSRAFGSPFLRKRLERCDVYLKEMEGPVSLQVYWRGDNNQKWNQWNESPVEVCAQVSDPEDPLETVHVWKNLLPQQRPQIKSFTIPSTLDEITRYSLITGFQFQLRVVWTGRTKIDKTVLHSTLLDDPAYAMRDVVSDQCLENNVTNNEIIYRIPSAPCGIVYHLNITLNPESVNIAFLGTVELSYRRQTGTPSLCGFNEHLLPATVPPRRFRRATSSGEELICLHGNNTCDGTDRRFAQSIDWNASTDSTTSVTTCDQVTGQAPYVTVGGSEPPCVYSAPVSPSFTANGPPPPGAATEVTPTSIITRTPISNLEIFNGVGCISTPPFYSRLFGTYQNLLSEEDTETDAINRFEAANPQGVWAGVSLNAYWEQRTSSFSFEFGWSQFRVEAGGYTPGQTLSFEIPIFRSPYPSGTFVLQQIVTVDTNADGSGNVDFFMDIPNAPGFVSRADAASVFTPA